MMKVRGHHLVCTYCFFGSGKKRAKDFFGVENAIPELLRKLQDDPERVLTVVDDMDDVCEVCPLKRPDGCGRAADAAAQNRKLRSWDAAILKRLGLRAGDRIKARELEERIRQRIPDIGEICVNCTSASPSGWSEYRKAIREGLWVKGEGRRAKGEG